MAIPAYYSLIQNGSTGPDVALVQTCSTVCGTAAHGTLS